MSKHKTITYGPIEESEFIRFGNGKVKISSIDAYQIKDILVDKKDNKWRFTIEVYCSGIILEESHDTNSRHKRDIRYDEIDKILKEYGIKND